MTKRIAMWSGPRNLSTAMMYSFAARGDTRVVDEPFYAAYLAQTGADHPLQSDVLNAQPTDPKTVIKSLTSPVSEPIFYQKHMTHHMLPDWSMNWIGQVSNVFLIRHPTRVIASYARKRERPTLDDIGFAQQVRIIESVKDPIVLDSSDIRANPSRMLQKLCAAIGVPWTENMLHWPSGGHPNDGVWASHWYGAVHRSTGFDGPEGPLPDLNGQFAELAEQAIPYFERMSALKITLDADPGLPTA